MAKTVTNPKVGQIVYEAYEPATVGRIVEIISPRSPDHVLYSKNIPHADKVFFARVRVVWIKKHPRLGVQEGETTTRSLMDFEALVLEHERKAQKHRATLRHIQEWQT